MSHPYYGRSLDIQPHFPFQLRRVLLSFKHVLNAGSYTSTVSTFDQVMLPRSEILSQTKVMTTKKTGMNGMYMVESTGRPMNEYIR